MAPAVTILACGDPMRADDGAVLAALELLPAAARRRTEIRRISQLDPEDLREVADGRPCIVGDAVAGLAAGTVIVRRLDAMVGRSASPGPTSTHALDLGQALGIAQAMGALPDGWFLGIGGQDFTLHAGLSPALRAHLPFAATVLEAIVTMAGRQADGDA